MFLENVNLCCYEFFHPFTSFGFFAFFLTFGALGKALLQASPDGSFYTVKTAFKSRKGEWIELLWSDAQSQTIVSGKQQDFAVDPQSKTGEENPSTLSKSNSSNEKILPASGEIKANTEDSDEELPRNKRNNAGVKLAEKLSSVVGGTLDIWMLGKHRKSRKPIIDSYIVAFGKAHNGGKR